MKDWGTPLMITLTSKKVADAISVSDFAAYWHRHWIGLGIPHAIRIEFQRRRSAHLHGVAPDVSRETLDGLKRDWLKFIGEADDKDTQRYGFHAARVSARDDRWLILYVSGHTAKGDYQSTAPYPIRRWFWIYDAPLPDLEKVGEIDKDTLAVLRLRHGLNDIPPSYGGTLVLDIKDVFE